MIARWLIRIVAVASIAVCIAVTVVDAGRGWTTDGLYTLYGACAVTFVAVGWLLAERRAGNAVGLVMLAFGVLFAWYLPADLYLSQPGVVPGAAFAALFISSLDAPMFILIALVLIAFPDGRVPSIRWRPAVTAGIAGIGLAAIGAAFEPGPTSVFPAYRSPLGIPGFPGSALVYLAYFVMLALLVLAVVALVTRWRSGDAVRRAQIKWVVAATMFLLAAELVNVVTYRPENLGVANVVATIALALVPIAICIAVLRYRLYEIDRIISRTLSYAVLTGILALVFSGVILLLQTLLTPVTGGQTIAVAASTLAVFALFQPVLRRVRQTVDRRFDRARYDADVTVRTFAARLRGDIDLDAVNSEIVGTATSAVRPTKAGVWLRGATRAGRTTESS